MDTISTVVTIIVVLAILFVPQVLVAHFADKDESARDEYVPDGR